MPVIAATQAEGGLVLYLTRIFEVCYTNQGFAFIVENFLVAIIVALPPHPTHFYIPCDNSEILSQKFSCDNIRISSHISSSDNIDIIML